MISKKSAEAIYHCHREIEAGENLLADMQKICEERKRDDFAPTLRDVFGSERQLQLGIPSGASGHRLFQVSFEMALPIIKTHISNKRAELFEASQIALVEAQEQ